jgi:predicted ATPase
MRGPVQIADLTELRRRAFRAFAALLNALLAQRMVVLCLDDLHWGDSDSAALFARLFSVASIPPFVLVAAFRTEDFVSEFRKLWQEHVTAAGSIICRTILNIGPLSPNAAVELTRSLLARRGVDNEEVASSLASQCDGNPLFLEQLVLDFVRSHSPGEVLRPLTFKQLIHNRVQRLSKCNARVSPGPGCIRRAIAGGSRAAVGTESTGQ